GVVAIFAERMLAGLPIVIYGDGEQTRDFVFVSDVVHAFVLAMTRGDAERMNIGTGERTSVNDLYRALASATHYGAQPVRAPERPGELRHSALDCSKAAHLLGWKPWTTLAEGLETTLAGAGRRGWHDE
ncbi:MAG: GDP-mannose 4,6-dehydratase, partial [Actinomycetota bacterium]|nr:GDP-mannose 4,6-dehydratase [Actinomycetota bacterium]